MKIAISGAHGVGKSTLAKKIAEEFNLPRIDEVARGIAKIHGFDTNQQILDASVKKKELFQSDVFEGQLFKEGLYDSFISDRSVFDVVAYMQFYNLNNIIFKYRDKAVEHSSNYSLIIFCPIPKDQGDIENDNFRMTNKKDQREYGSLVFQHSCCSQCPVLLLPASNRDMWFDQCKTILRGV